MARADICSTPGENLCRHIVIPAFANNYAGHSRDYVSGALVLAAVGIFFIVAEREGKRERERRVLADDSVNDIVEPCDGIVRITSARQDIATNFHCVAHMYTHIRARAREPSGFP